MSTSSQLPLNLTPRFSYSIRNFVWHTGVTELAAQVTALLESSPPRFSFIYGEKRSGKTHFSIALADRLIARGLRPVLLEGSEFSRLVLTEQIRLLEKETLVVDDCEVLFNELGAGDSGPVVRFFEALRVNEIGLVLLSGKQIVELPCDEHITSRLRGCAQMQIAAPEYENVPKVLDCMAKQRGLSLGGRRLKFLEKRVSRSIPEIEDYLSRLAYLADLLGKRVNFSTLGDALKPIKGLLF